MISFFKDLKKELPSTQETKTTMTVKKTTTTMRCGQNANTDISKWVTLCI